MATFFILDLTGMLTVLENLMSEAGTSTQRYHWPVYYPCQNMAQVRSAGVHKQRMEYPKSTNITQNQPNLIKCIERVYF
mgnify:CR=1 FL=1